MAEKVPWWKVFIPKKKSADPYGLGPDFNPFAQQPDRLKDPSSSSKTATTTDQTIPAQGSSFLSDETFDDSKLESVFNEQTCRRNMKVSRSGRFKEKRRPRSTLPIEEKGREAAAAGREDKR
ncbi:PREDICTED: proline-rich protein 15-like [Poecilia mexicana]|uniref:proline-rich protein 15 n=1 Tax=Poecilia formosa TaxID=48698 RepID=UPI000444578D|nr:PREDICTED: proline-rich protein 15 [Poecilia formosa]XP_007562713.1 PREDICTED: proline-rich protein 15 [Poecilia formosa]XP_014852181.1 PREDICTED: proline-rich protein 15-like [Poecilia mexicana]XP_014852182.1 PREDICTED: proline-rich protein 15-like [Poecilia mexicana]